MCIFSFSYHNNPMRQELLLSSFSEEAEQLGKMHMTTEGGQSRAIQLQTPRERNLHVVEGAGSRPSVKTLSQRREIRAVREITGKDKR